jgi:hypothetical protein
MAGVSVAGGSAFRQEKRGDQEAGVGDKIGFVGAGAEGLSMLGWVSVFSPTASG